MKEALVDTNILSLFFRGHPQVVTKFTAYLAEYSTIRFSIITELVNRADFSRMPWASKATISNHIGAGYGSLAELAILKDD
jgi:hypothetical protein